MALRPGHAVDNHPDRQRIIDDIVAGHLSLDAIGRKYRLAKNTIWKYRRDVIGPTLRRVSETTQALQAIDPACVKTDTAEVEKKLMDATGAVLAAEPYIKRTEQLWQVTQDAIERAKNAVRVVRDRETGELVAAGDDVRAIAPLIDQAHKNIELSARLTHVLDAPQAPAANVAVVVLPVAGLPGPAAPVPQVLPAGAVRFLPPGEPADNG
jgi:hypothetical protein